MLPPDVIVVTVKSKTYVQLSDYLFVAEHHSGRPHHLDKICLGFTLLPVRRRLLWVLNDHII